jgi:hypothetical protein
VARPTRVALYNDYELVLEGLRALLRPYAPEIRIVELDIRRPPRRRVDVTLLDTYGERETPNNASGALSRIPGPAPSSCSVSPTTRDLCDASSRPARPGSSPKQ